MSGGRGRGGGEEKEWSNRRGEEVEGESSVRILE